nr:MAG TPA: hypothetical protein [Bacteriophage sp.]
MLVEVKLFLSIGSMAWLAILKLREPDSNRIEYWWQSPT